MSSDFTLKEVNQYYRTKLNTYNFNIISAPETSQRLSVKIPPFPLPTHQRSSLAIFKLKEFWICGQDNTAGERAGGVVTNDISGFCVRFKGLGLRGTNFSNLSNTLDPDYETPKPTQEFLVINRYGALDNGGGTARDSYQVNSGNGDLSQEVVCSNPTGTELIIEVVDLDDQQPIIPDGFYFATRFEIEVIPDEVSRGVVS